MKLIPVKSSNVVAVGYDPQLRALFVQYKDGSYRYDMVPPNVWAALMAAESVGKFLHKHVRAIYPYTKLDRIVSELPVQVADTIVTQEAVCPQDV